MKLNFAYDYLNRRVETRVTAWDMAATPPLDPNDASGNWKSTPEQVRRYVWAGWLRLAELEADANDPNDANRIRPLRQFTWGLDLSQTLAGAGGIGGLLGSLDFGADPNSTADDRRLLFFYDGNGNVVQLVDAAADPNDPNGLAAHYEYDAFGTVMAQAGGYAAENAVRFSTKPFDERMGLGDWGRRWYSAELGRWASWDPLGERAGVNQYAYVHNRPVEAIDAIGEKTYAIDGTWWNALKPSNTLAMAETDSDGFYYLSGVNLTASDFDAKVYLLHNKICADRCDAVRHCKTPPIIDLVGWSRGAVAIVRVAWMLKTDGCDCTPRPRPGLWATCGRGPIPIHSVILFDPVNMGGIDKDDYWYLKSRWIPSNVEIARVAFRDVDAKPGELAFPPWRMRAEPGVDFRARAFAETHGDIGTTKGKAWEWMQSH